MNSIKKININREFFIFDIFLFLYISALISHKRGYGFDAIYCRLTFVALVAVAAVKIFLDIKRGKNISIIYKHLLWLGLFWGYAALSIFWAMKKKYIYEFNWNTTIQIFLTSFLFAYRIKNRTSFNIILKIMLFSIIYLGLLVLSRIPIDQIGAQRMGNVAGIHSNAFGKFMAFGSLISIYIYIEFRHLKYLFFVPFFLILMFLSGSRGAILLCLGGILGFVFLFSKNLKKYIYIFIFIIFLYIILNWLITNPTMYRLVGWRLEGLIGLFSSEHEIDASTSGRLFFIESAQELFSKYPLFGAGLDNFQYYVWLDGFSRELYSHCNHWELLSTLGIVGYLLFYSLYFSIIIKGIKKNVSMNKPNRFAFVLIIVILVIDYVIISYYDVFTQFMVAICFFGMCVSEKDVKKITTRLKY